MFKIKRKSSEHSPGLIAYLIHDLARFDDFYQSLMSTLVPEGSLTHRAKGADIVAKLNDSIEMMYKHNLNWIWFLGDDHTWDQSLLVKLLERNLDVVVPLCARRAPPFSPTLFKNEQDAQVPGAWKVLNWTELPTSNDLLKVEGRVGTAGMLIRKRVLDKVGFPWFEIGKECSFLLQEDMYWCRKVQEAGFDIYCDLKNTIDHICVGKVRPAFVNGKWGLQWDFGQGVAITLFPEEKNA